MVTKADTNRYELSEFLENIQEIKETNVNFSIECRVMLNTIIERRNIALFPFAPLINDEIIKNIRQQIDELPESILQDGAHISIDTKSKLMLTDLAMKITDDLNKVSRFVRAGIERDFVDVNYTDSK